MVNKLILKNIAIFGAGVTIAFLGIIGLNSYNNIKELEGEK